MNEDILREKLLTFRAKYGMTQMEFAKAAGMSHTTIIKLENGKKITQLSMAKINLFIENYEG